MNIYKYKYVSSFSNLYYIIYSVKNFKFIKSKFMQSNIKISIKQKEFKSISCYISSES